ncbi:PREDICTED: 7-deoxyloganetic [Prunus dulcis]|uniref:PREDICTED: 7-deoxyloganetic n=1 Tax=Prunus dulcis TaxID=3755 RepID=A0A5E4E9Q9_PRUDU|nr:PREDICTED: 7-deoxyloganetic [Prunus dulcis]
MVNSRLASEVWELGFDMKDRCDRVIREKMIRDLMGERKVEFMKSATEMADLARASVNQEKQNTQNARINTQLLNAQAATK